jgi:hypothetical protein
MARGRGAKAAQADINESSRETTKKRSPNFTESEKQLLLKLVKENADVIESKKTDHVSNEEKAAAWAALCTAFNTQSGVHSRSVESLRNLWDNQKKQAKHSMAKEKLETFKTSTFFELCCS